jgi:hypothetical protein
VDDFIPVPEDLAVRAEGQDGPRGNQRSVPGDEAGARGGGGGGDVGGGEVGGQRLELRRFCGSQDVHVGMMKHGRSNEDATSTALYIPSWLLRLLL